MNHLIRNALFVAVAACAGLLFVLIAYALFAFPSISQPGPQQSGLQDWLGADRLRWVYVAIALLLTGAYIGVALAPWGVGGTFGQSAAVGIVAGCATGVVAAVASVRSGLLATSPQELQGGANLAIQLFFLTPLVAGICGYVVTRRPAASVFWGSVTFAVLFATVSLARDIVLADHLAHTAWVGDPTCVGLSGSSLAGCEIGDDLGGLTFMLLVSPLLGAFMLGVSMIDRAVNAQSRTPGEVGVRWSRVTVGPMLFAALMVTILVVRLTTRLF